MGEAEAELPGGRHETDDALALPARARLAVCGWVVRDSRRQRRLEPILDLGANERIEPGRLRVGGELTEPCVDAQEQVVLELLFRADRRRGQNILQLVAGRRVPGGTGRPARSELELDHVETRAERL